MDANAHGATGVKRGMILKNVLLLITGGLFFMPLMTIPGWITTDDPWPPYEKWAPHYYGHRHLANVLLLSTNTTVETGVIYYCWGTIPVGLPNSKGRLGISSIRFSGVPRKIWIRWRGGRQ
jgi:hypothetical protein